MQKLINEIKRLIKSQPELPPCGDNGGIMLCYCGKCKQKEYGLPEDFKKLLAIKVAEEYTLLNIVKELLK